VYYYWQRKLREAVYKEMLPRALTSGYVAIVLPGWTVCEQKEEVGAVAKEIVIEIGKCHIEATPDTDPELLIKVCRTLVSLC
jgi:hypothetical protein